MFCPKCGTSLSADAEFCSNCGTNLKTIKASNETLQANQTLHDEQNSSNQGFPAQTNTESTMTETLAKKSKDFVSPITKKIKDLALDYI